MRSRLQHAGRSVPVTPSRGTLCPNVSPLPTPPPDKYGLINSAVLHAVGIASLPRSWYGCAPPPPAMLASGPTCALPLCYRPPPPQAAVAILSRVGRKPRNVLLAAMFTATFASMWISNVAAPVLCFGLIQPILRWGRGRGRAERQRLGWGPASQCRARMRGIRAGRGRAGRVHSARLLVPPYRPAWPCPAQAHHSMQPHAAGRAERST